MGNHTPSPNANQVLAHALWPADRQWLLRAVLLALAGSLLLTISAKTKIPLLFIEMTLQPMAIVFLGLALGRNLAVASVLVYLAQGAAGLPVFTGTPEKGIGLVYMMGPTGGYLFGFILAAMVVGTLADRGWARRYTTALVAAFAGLALIYIPGAAWLAYLFNVETAITAGVMPFIAKDLVSVALVTLAVPALWAAMQKPR